MTNPPTVEWSRRRFLAVTGGAAVGVVVGRRKAFAGKRRNAPAGLASGSGTALQPTIQTISGDLYSDIYADMY